ncbi:hypothetical protein [Nitrosomonas sp.]|uniref:hypothetical protein n=1 Tax=Nitrosomonas sp. TaxID=42353 RepID=UPI001DB1AC81|nr:hypothetical protein [Nitrosomonas sp.]MBX3616930.1 hypothetical protein [Nitrosomonas sp.]
MNTRTSKLTSLLLTLCLALILATPSLAEAGRGHRGHGHHHGHHHHKHHHGGYGGGYGYVYSQPPGYYQPYYPQPRYNYYNNYYPAPIYTLPPQMMMGIGTGNMDFMIRF